MGEIGVIWYPQICFRSTNGIYINYKTTALALVSSYESGSVSANAVMNQIDSNNMLVASSNNVLYSSNNSFTDENIYSVGLNGLSRILVGAGF